MKGKNSMYSRKNPSERSLSSEFTRGGGGTSADPEWNTSGEDCMMRESS